MASLLRRRSIARFVLAVAVASLALGGIAATPDQSVAARSRWDGSIDLYRSGVFTTQKTWLWCTAADAQIMRNIADGKRDHTKASQQRYFDYMRRHNRYDIPVKDGVDPAGWAAGLRHYVDSRYRLEASRSFNAALRSAVTSLRRTNLPVGITVAHGSHAWIITGFSATADPATTEDFTVTSVRVVGPLWGLQSRTRGYDMRPNTKLTPRQLKSYFTPWHYAGVKMAWEGRWVSIQPISKAKAAPTEPKATAKPTAAPSPTVRLSPSPAPTVIPTATPLAGSPPPTEGAAAVAAVAASPSADRASPPSAVVGSTAVVEDTAIVPIGAGLLLALAGVAVATGLARRSRTRP